VTQFSEVENCCTARILEYLPKWEGRNDLQRLGILREIRNSVEDCSEYGHTYAVFICIVTDNQYNKDGAKELLIDILKFEEVYVGEKEERGQRHKETGELHIFCTSPPKFVVNLSEKIKEYEDLTDPKKKAVKSTVVKDKDELLRRVGFPEFKLTRFDPRKKWLSTEVIPVSAFTRGGFNDLVRDYTGGYEPMKDEYFAAAYQIGERKTLSEVKRRALSWRNGEF
jgi:hypothetical protein